MVVSTCKTGPRRDPPARTMCDPLFSRVLRFTPWLSFDGNYADGYRL